ncbi:hypothetical protein SGCZBJ_03745 [Caulobacter zeae]|uniref:Uncharacterized protein n=1 Tax=Caulobacter zeae TaxID=2055137 RepID=A0A2N5DPZ6_9CAUL|nr:hypothetical protein [Caulobacter zeae]PLR28131.1 hypothetical protein SGCZBJ_03745 [Caulobacter zeae]
MADELRLRTPQEKALEQLLRGVLFWIEYRFPGGMEEIFRVGAGSPRFDVETDVAYGDLVATIKNKARQAGRIE